MQVNAPFEKTWNAVIDILGNDNIPVTTLDKNSGFVVAERTRIVYASKAERDAVLALADCGGNGLGMTFVPTSARYNIVVRPNGNATTVKATASYQSPAAAGCTSKGTFETQLETAIKQRAETR